MTSQTTPVDQLTIGTTFCRRGWRGLVSGRFDSGETTSKQWLGRVGFHTHARLMLEDTPSAYKLESSANQLPGSPEEFAARSGCTLAEVPAVQF